MNDGWTIAIAASFTAEPLATVLEYWLKERKLGEEIEFAPFDQVLQSLHDPTSLFFATTPGLNVVLLRLQDLGARAHARASLEAIETIATEVVAAAKAAVARTPRPLLVVVAPASPAVAGDADFAATARRIETSIAAESEKTPGLYFLGSADIVSRYDFSEGHDAYGDREGRIPYTPLGFAGIATMIARRLDAMRRRSPFKVIAVDCDQTLWNGVVGEDGADGIVIDEGRKRLQAFLAEQMKSYGMLLALCTKNNEADVQEVFQTRSDMVLRRGDFIAARINWERKSDNLRSLAEELQLGLDTFIFLDDDPVQCADVRGGCAGVTVVELPKDSNEAVRTVLETWELDHAKVTDEDRRRTEFYFQNREREIVRTTAATLEEYLGTLGIVVTITPVTDEQLARVAQLTQRTNQFNCGAVKRTESELERLRATGAEILVVDVRDRFGEYGLVGAVIFQAKAAALEVDTFLLSCRALGRRVEHTILERLREEAAARGLPRVHVFFRRTAKNQPAADFLAAAEAPWKGEHQDVTVYGFDAMAKTP